MKRLLVAMDKNNAIGFKNDLPWGRGLKDDLANFKRLTKGTSVLMGRKTFESIGKKPLPERENIVITHTPTGVPGVLSAGSIASAYSLARYPISVIGGQQIYEQTLHDMDELYITQIEGEFADADTFFPALDASHWKEAASEVFEKNERNTHAFRIVRYVRVDPTPQ
jgi:dihydrofolate reductase